MATFFNVDPELTERGTWVLVNGGPDLWLESAYRPDDEQRVLWNKYQDALNKYGTREKVLAMAPRTGVYPANPPGQSKHGFKPAQAIDIACKSGAEAKRADLIARAGLWTPIAGEKHHCELAPHRKPLPRPKEEDMSRTLTPEQRADKAKWGSILVDFMGTPSSGGFWLVTADGGVFSFGDAVFHGSAGGLQLNAPMIGATRTDSGNGYWLYSEDGGVFAYGDAQAAKTADGTEPHQLFERLQKPGQ